MPYDNEYNRMISRDIDYYNRKYVMHCSSTGQGTIDYRADMTGGCNSCSGAGAGSATFHSGDDSSSDGYNSSSDGENVVGRGGAILGIQAGTVLGGPKVKRDTRKLVSSFSSLGAPVGFRRDVNNDPLSVPAESSPPPPAAPAPGGEQVGKGGAILGPVQKFDRRYVYFNPHFGAQPVRNIGNVKSSYSSLGRPDMPMSGMMYKAGEEAYVRDLGNGRRGHGYTGAGNDSESEEEEGTGNSESEEEEEGQEGAGASSESDYDYDDNMLNRDNSETIKGMQNYSAGYCNGVFDPQEEEAPEGAEGALPNETPKMRDATQAKNPEGFSGTHKAGPGQGPSGNKSGPSQQQESGMHGYGKSGVKGKKKGDKGGKPDKKDKTPEEKAADKAKKDADKKAKKDKKKEEKDKERQTDKDKKKAEKDAKKKADREAKKNADKEAKNAKKNGKKGEEEPSAPPSKDGKKGKKEGKKEGKDAKDGKKEGKDAKDGKKDGKKEEPKVDAKAPKGAPTMPNGGPTWLTTANKALDLGLALVQTINGFKMYSETPEDDFFDMYGDELCDDLPEDADIEDIIQCLKDQGYDDDEIQKFLSLSQGAISTAPGKNITESLKVKVSERDKGNKNKDTTCLDALNEIGDSTVAPQPELKPIKKTASYFGGYFKETINATSHHQTVPKVQAQMNSRIGYGSSRIPPSTVPKVLAKPKPKPDLKMPVVQAIAPQIAMPVIGKGSKLVEPPIGAKLPSKIKVGKGGKSRADIVKSVMKGKGMSMIDASKYVKANGLY